MFLRQVYQALHTVFAAFLVGLLSLFGAQAKAADGLEATFELVAVPPAPTKSAAGKVPRRLFLLVDYSGSMNNKPDGFGQPGENTRWEAVEGKIKQQLKDVWAQDPAVEVTIRFFHSQVEEGKRGGLTDPLPPPKVLANQSAGSFSLPPAPSAGNGTALYRAISATCQVIKNQLRGCEMPDWIALVVVSDGEDSEKRDQDKRLCIESLTQLKVDFPTLVTGVIPVGKEAEAMIGKGAFGTLKEISRLPTPPPPRPRFELKSLKACIDVGEPMSEQGGREQVNFQVDGSLPKGWSFVASTIAESTSGAAEKSVPASAAQPRGQITVVSSLRDAAQSGEITIELRAVQTDSTADDGPVVVGTPRTVFRFRPAQIPSDPSQWRINGPSALRIGSSAEFLTSIGNAERIEWKFRGPSGAQTLTKDGTTVAFDASVAGRWSIDLKATSSDKKTSDRADVMRFEVVDASVEVSGPAKSYVGTPVSFVAKRLGQSPSVMTWFVDGEERTEFRGKEEIRLVPSDVRTFDIVCVNTSEVGAFQFQSRASLAAELAPGIVPLDSSRSVECLEIDETVVIPLRVFAFRKVQWKVGDKQQSDIELVFEPGAREVKDIRLQIDLRSLRKELQTQAESAQPPLVIPVSWWGVGADGKAGEAGGGSLVIQKVNFVIGMKSPMPGTPLVKGSAHELVASAELAPLEGRDAQELSNQLEAIAARLELTLRNGDGNEITDLKQPPQPVKKGLATITIAPPGTLADREIQLSARVSSDSLLYPTNSSLVAKYPLELPRAAYQIATPSDFKAYSDLKFEIQGLTKGDSVRWTITAKPDRVVLSWIDNQATTSTAGKLAQQLSRGTYTVSAMVTRIDGTTETPPAHDFEVKSSVSLKVDQWAWQDGTSIPALEGELEGDPKELQGAVVHWSCEATAGDAGCDCRVIQVPGTYRFKVELLSAQQCAVPTVRVSAIVNWQHSPPLEVAETAKLELLPTALLGNPTIEVGGQSGAGYGGGVVVVPFPGIRGPYCEGSVSIRVRFNSDLADSNPRSWTQRVVRGVPSGQWIDDASGTTSNSITASSDEIGKWSVVIVARLPGQETDVALGSEATFTLRKKPNWLKAGLCVIGGLAVALLIVKLGRGNRAMRISLTPIFSEEDERRRSGGIRPTIWPWHRKRPRFGLWTKSASMPLVRFSPKLGLIPETTVKANFGSRWVLDAKGECTTEVRWDGGAVRIMDDYRDLHPADQRDVLEIAPVPYQDFSPAEHAPLQSLRIRKRRPSTTSENAAECVVYIVAALTLMYSVFLALSVLESSF